MVGRKHGDEQSDDAPGGQPGEPGHQPQHAQGDLNGAAPIDQFHERQDTDATAETIVDGRLDTGDLVAADEQSYLWFRGRKKQIIVHDGSNICPQEVEEALLEHTAVASAGVIGIHDPLHGETVRAYIVFKPDVQPPTTTALIQFARTQVGYKAPDEIIVLEEMPTTAVGKVDRVALRELAAGAVSRHFGVRGVGEPVGRGRGALFFARGKLISDAVLCPAEAGSQRVRRELAPERDRMRWSSRP